MRSLVGQFRVQIDEYTSLNPNGTRPNGLSSRRPLELPEAEVLWWKFHLLDSDQDGRLEDREWCKFKMNFRLVDRLDGQADGGARRGASWSPLSILRPERLCWRDLLDWCAGGRLLVRDSIDLARWMGCMGAGSGGWRGRERGAEWRGSGASSGEAAAARRKKKNPFAGILRAD